MALYDISNFKNQKIFMVLYGFQKLNLTEKIYMYMLDIYHVMMVLYDIYIYKCAIERLDERFVQVFKSGPRCKNASKIARKCRKWGVKS